MSVVRLCGVNVLRRRWAGVVLVALLVGFGGGAVLAAAAGARRSETAATRLYERGKVADVEMDPVSSFTTNPTYVTSVRRLPEVTRATSALFFAMAPVEGGRLPTQASQLNAYAAANADGTFLYDFDRVGLLPSFRGRMPNPSRADEMIATTQQARLLHATVGSTVHLAVARFADPNSFTPTDFEPITVHIVGIATTPVGLLRSGATSETLLFGTPAFAREYSDRSVGSTMYVQLRRATDLATFERHVTKAVPGVAFNIKPAAQDLSTFQRVADPYTNALWIFALVAGLAALLIVSQALIRMVRADAADYDGLRAIGATSVQRAAIAATRGFVVVLLGTAIAVAVAVAASPLFPLGLVRRVEPDPGLRIDGTVPGLGVVGIVVALGAVVLLSARLVTRSTPEAVEGRARRQSRTSSALGRVNAPVSIVQGTRLAFQRGTTTASVSTAASIVGLVAAIAATAAALVFGANLAQLQTPSRYGQTWDAEIVPAGSSSSAPDQAEHTLVSHGLVTATTLGTFGDIKLGGTDVSAYGMQPRRGHVLPVATSGRLPQGSGEIALGAQTLRQLHLAVGATVTATAENGGTERLRVVGTTLVPTLNSNTPSVGADDGALLTRAGLIRLEPDLGDELDFLLVNFAPHVDLHDVQSRLETTDFTVTGASPPGDIASYTDVRSTPLVLAGLISLLGIGVLVHLLVTSVRSNRRELAVLETLGSTRGQLRAMVLWQAIVLVGAALAVGLVIGVAAGQGAWTHFADNLDLLPHAHIPLGSVAAIAGVALVGAAAIAMFPARAATRTAPAVVLREP